MDEPVWYLIDETERQIGPLPEHDFRRRIAGPNLGPHTPVWRDGMDDWRPAADVPELRDLFHDPNTQTNPTTTPPNPQSPDNPTPTAKHDDVAVFMAIGSHIANLFFFPASLLAIIPIAMNRDPFSRFHGVQAITVFIAYLIMGVICAILTPVTCGVSWLLLLPLAVLYYIDVIFGIVYACKQRMTPTPIVGRLAVNRF